MSKYQIDKKTGIISTPHNNRLGNNDQFIVNEKNGKMEVKQEQ